MIFVVTPTNKAWITSSPAFRDVSLFHLVHPAPLIKHQKKFWLCYWFRTWTNELKFRRWTFRLKGDSSKTKLAWLMKLCVFWLHQWWQEKTRWCLHLFACFWHFWLHLPCIYLLKNVSVYCCSFTAIFCDISLCRMPQNDRGKINPCNYQ